MTTVRDVAAMPATMPTVLVVATSPTSLLSVAGLPLLVRSVLALRSAGFADIAVLTRNRDGRFSPLVARRLAETDVTWLAIDRSVDPSGWSNRVLVLSADVVFDPDALRATVTTAATAGVMVATPDGEIGALTCSRGAVLPLVAALADGARTLGEAVGHLGHRDGAPVLLGDGLFQSVGAGHPPDRLTRAVLDHLGRRTASTDGHLATLLDRHLSRAITRLLLPRLWATPNRITLASIVVGLVGAMALASVSYWTRLAGTLALLVSGILDGVDGEVARARFEQSAAGARLDLAGDYLVHVATFIGLAIGLARGGLPVSGAWAAVALVAGVVAAMALVHVLVLRSPRRTTMTAAIERLASRDYAYLLFLGAVVGHLEWFLYAAALGSWVFVAALLTRWSTWR